MKNDIVSSAYTAEDTSKFLFTYHPYDSQLASEIMNDKDQHNKTNQDIFKDVNVNYEALKINIDKS